MKKGNVFLIEFMIVIPFLLAFFIYMQPYLKDTVHDSDILGNYAGQSIATMRTTQVAELESAVRAFIPAEHRCMDCSVSRQVAILMYYGEEDPARKLTESVVGRFVPSNYGVSIVLTGASINDLEYNVRNIGINNSIIIHGTYVSSIEESSNDVFLLQVKLSH